MGFITMVKKCPKCRGEYIFNPDVGRGLKCPHCGYVSRNPMRPGRPIKYGKEFRLEPIKRNNK